MHTPMSAGSPRPTSYVHCLFTQKKSVAEKSCPDRHVEHHTSGGQVVSDLPAAELCIGLESSLHPWRGYHFDGTNAPRLPLGPCSSRRRYDNFLREWRIRRLNLGTGAAGNFPIGIIAIVSLTKIERRGLFMGMMNAGFTAGIAFGAVLAGLLEPAVGWVEFSGLIGWAKLTRPACHILDASTNRSSSGYLCLHFSPYHTATE